MTSGPDFVFELKDGRRNVLWSGEAALDDAGPRHFPQGYPMSRPLMIADWNAQYSLVVYDRDVTGLELVGRTLTPFSVADLARQGYPTTVNIFSDEISARLTLSYE